jgi:protein-S-isoprenylcysteine O-methyltransferase Ste14
MPVLALAFLAVYGLLAFGVRMVVQVRRTGSTGFAALRAASGSMRRAGELLFSIAIVLCLVGGPVLQLSGTLDPVGALVGEAPKILGIVLALLGLALTVLAQFAMGDAWRIGVDPREHTELVTGGPFAAVRNPIYAAMIPAFAGISLLTPNVVTLAGATLVMVALELQTRLIEEPHLRAIHGERYAAYAARVGRFFPGVGRLCREGERPARA